MAYRPDGGTVLLRAGVGGWQSHRQGRGGGRALPAAPNSALVPSGDPVFLLLSLSPGHHLISGLRLWRMTSIQILA